MAQPVSEIPFYIQITNVKEDYINSQGKAQTIDLPLVTLPAGTLLFRGLKIPNPTKGEDIRYFYRDFLGTPEGSENVCLSPTHNVFFYPFPYVAFGVHDVGKTYTMMQAVVLVNPVTVVACISPSPFARGKANAYSGTAPWQRCDSFSGPDYDCHPETPKDKDEKYYDNCLLPEYQLRSSTRGWMAIANQDSIRPKDKGRNPKISTSSMAPFLRSLNAQIPGEGKKALAWTYTDDSKKAGFPEIALYPYRKHKGKRPFQRECPTNAAAMKLLEREAANNNLNYLPIAAFTKEGTVDMVNGYFSYDRLSIKPNSFNTVSAQQVILNHVHTFMQRMKTDGIDLPYYGQCKLTFDSRTGFFALDKVVPKSLQIQTSLYRSLLMPLNTRQAEDRAMRYMLTFRNFLPEHFMEPYALDKGLTVKRAIIFNHYPVLADLFTYVDMEVPQEFLRPLGNAGRLHRKETARVKKTLASAAAKAKPEPIRIPEPIATASALENEPSANEPSPAYAPITPPATGGAKTRRTKKVKENHATKKAHEYAALFKNIWNKLR
jgi:hypothetical protein